MMKNGLILDTEDVKKILAEYFGVDVKMSLKASTHIL